MRGHPTAQVLDEYGLSASQWAVLSSAHFHLALSWNAVVAGAAAKLPREWRLADVAAATQECLDRAWLEPRHTSSGRNEVALSFEGRRIKEEVTDHLKEPARRAVVHAA
jgi:hypothetical protein